MSRQNRLSGNNISLGLLSPDAHREIRRAGAPPGPPGIGGFNQPVLQRVKRDDGQPSARVQRLQRALQQPLQLPVPPEKLDVAHGEQGKPQGKAQHEGIAHRLQRQAVEVEDGGADAQAPRQEEEQLPVPPEIRAQDSHTVSCSTR